MEDRKKRGSNFSNTDVDLLMRSILSEIKVIENKVTDGSSQKEKQLSWRKITNDFNSVSGAYRDTNSLKIKYDNIKRTLKKKIIAAKQNYMGTGGGPAIIPNLLWYEEQLYANLKLGIEGLPSAGDLDSLLAGNRDIIAENDATTSSEPENIYVIYEEEKENILEYENQESIGKIDFGSTATRPSTIEVMGQRQNNRQIPKSKSHEEPNVASSSGTGQKLQNTQIPMSSKSHVPNVASSSGTNISKNWNLKKRPRNAVTRQQKLSSQEAFQKLAHTKTEMSTVQKECYELELKEKTLEAQRKIDEWTLKKQILECELNRKTDEKLEFSEECRRKRKLHELTEEEMKLKLEILKCELNIKLKKSLS